MARGGFPGMPGGGNMQQLMRQAQKMQQQMLEMQEALDSRTYDSSSGGGMVKAKVNGKRELLELTIDPTAVDPEDVEMLQDLILAAVNEAIRSADADREKEMSRFGGGMGGLL